MTHRWLAILAITLLMAGPGASAARALDHVICQRDGKTTHLEGKVIVQAMDGGVMMLSADGELVRVPASQLLEHRRDDKPFVPLTPEQMGQKLLSELPPGYQVHTTAHYLICHNTSQAFAQWCGSLFERLYTGFTNYWLQRGLKVHEPRMPLVVVVYADKSSYAHYSADDLRGNVNSVVGYFNMSTNRVTMYDITGVETLRLAGDKRGTTAQINQILSRPKAAAMVATIVHEATHQIAYNCGLHQRFGDIPLWFAEGLAMFFETPDLAAAKGWRTIGDVNRHRLTRFVQYLPRRTPDSLVSLLTDDSRFRDPTQMTDAYAEAWALTYFLLRQHPRQYQAYLERLSEKDPLVRQGSKSRLEEFTACFGNDLAALDNEFMRYMARVR